MNPAEAEGEEADEDDNCSYATCLSSASDESEAKSKVIIEEQAVLIQSLREMINTLTDPVGAAGGVEEEEEEGAESLKRQHELLTTRITHFKERFESANGRPPTKMDIMGSALRPVYLKHKAVVNLLEERRKQQRENEEKKASMKEALEENARLQRVVATLREQQKEWERRRENVHSLSTESDRDDDDDDEEDDSASAGGGRGEEDESLVPYLPPHRLGLCSDSLVVLNIYERKVMGMHAYHTGVVVHGKEYTFAASVGVFWSFPMKSGPSWLESVHLGTSTVTPLGFHSLLAGLLPGWPASSYHLVKKNCNHFSKALAALLLPGGCSFPPHVNRLADSIPSTLAMFV